VALTEGEHTNTEAETAAHRSAPMKAATGELKKPVEARSPGRPRRNFPPSATKQIAVNFREGDQGITRRPAPKSVSRRTPNWPRFTSGRNARRKRRSGKKDETQGGEKISPIPTVPKNPAVVSPIKDEPGCTRAAGGRAGSIGYTDCRCVSCSKAGRP